MSRRCPACRLWIVKHGRAMLRWKSAPLREPHIAVTRAHVDEHPRDVAAGITLELHRDAYAAEVVPECPREWKRPAPEIVDHERRVANQHIVRDEQLVALVDACIVTQAHRPLVRFHSRRPPPT